MDLSGTAYLWVKAFHVIFMVAWMAGLFYLPRLFVYHTQVEPDSATSDKFKVMEGKLLRIIMHPAMVITSVTGILLLLDLGDGAWSLGWVHVKLSCVLGLIGVHIFLARCVSDFARNSNNRSEKFYRIINEAPTLLMMAIVIAVIVKPFE